MRKTGGFDDLAVYEWPGAATARAAGSDRGTGALVQRADGPYGRGDGG